MKKPFTSPYLGLLLGIAAVSTASLLIRLAQVEAPSFVIAAGRLTIASLIIGLFAWKKLRLEIPNLSLRTLLLLLLAGFFLGFHFATWITSLEYTTVASSVVIVTTAPLWVAIFSPLILKEKITKWIVIGLIVSLAGSVIVGLNSACSIISRQLVCQSFFAITSGRMFIGNLLALLGAFLSAGYLIVGRRTRNSLSLSSYTFVVYSVAAAVLIFLVIITGQKITGFSTRTYLFIIALAVIPQLIGHSSFNWTLKFLSAAVVSIALLGEPIGTVILSFLFLKESPTILEIIGGLLILCGIIISTRSRSNPQVMAET
jgi:drug/metabolite transporter (DMT)-like permease